MLKVENLEKRFGHRAILQGVSLQLEAGETVALMGPSGCGKSTTIRCIYMLQIPDGGKILFKGEDITALSGKELLARRQEMGFVFQDYNLIRRLTARENVMLALMYRGLEAEEARKLAEGALREMGLFNGYDLRPHELSGGEQQRVALARALVTEPDLILLDEPTASLDPILAREVLSAIETLAAGKRGVLLVTHEVTLARRIAHRVLLMEGGQIVEEGSPGEIFKEPRSWVGQRYREVLEYG